MSRRRRKAEGFPLENDPLWYKDAIIYQLHVRAFHDSNGDGIGDFRGLVQKLDYFQDLGVTALWLLPFYPSPLRDDGYDIAHYTDIHPNYGTLADFKLFLREAQKRGLRVITELVVNHTSDQHPWFQRARLAKPGSKERDYYVWSDTPEKYKEARIIFKDFEPSNWTWDATANAYYWHRFFYHQPDLNFDNPEVHKAIFGVMDFWLGLGIDGLRLDAVPYLYEREGTNCENLAETHDFLKKLRKHVDEQFPGRMLLAEANQWPEDAVAYFGAGDECHMAFHFPVMPRLFMAIRMEDRFPVLDILQQTPAIPATSQWAIFLRNHDELTLEMVTDEDRDYMYRVYAQDPQARINLGIRRRLAPLLENHRGKIELMNGLLFSLPGTPIIYYGDEIGMGDNIYLGDRNGVRTPMQWNSERNAGFSRANPQRLYLPVIIDPQYHFEAINVEAQQNNPHSLLWWMKHLIAALRKRFKAFGRGSLEFLYPENHKVLALIRRYQEECILVVANLSRFIQFVELDLSAFQGMVPVEMLGRNTFPTIENRPYLLTLGPYAFYWFTLEKPHTDQLPPTVPGYSVPTLRLSGKWEGLFQGKSRAALEEILPAYLKGCSWFPRKTWTMEELKILEVIPISWDSSTAHLILVQVQYLEGVPETYFLPLAFATGKEADDVEARQPQGLVCRLQRRAQGVPAGENEQAILYDALTNPPLAKTLLDAIRRRRHFRGSTGELLASTLPAFRQSEAMAEPIHEPAVLKAEQSNTCLAYGDRWILKVLRTVEEGVNPELEIGRFLTEKAPFPNVAATFGSLKYRPESGGATTLAILQGFVLNQGDAWRLTLDSLSRFFERALTERERIKDLLLPKGSLLEFVKEDLPELAQELISSFLESARLLGQRTAEMHKALASVVEDKDFAPEPFTVLYQRSMYQSMRSQARQAFVWLRRRLLELPQGVQEEAKEMLGREEEILRRGHGILGRKITTMKIRAHGDYQLSQVLYTGKDFVIIGFDGEPGRHNSERRLKRSPLRDVACMVRSFHYATLAALHEGHLRTEDIPALDPWAHFWHRWVSVAFLKAYLEVAGQASFLPADPGETALLLDFYLLKRAVNELRYELGANLKRVQIPLRGLMELLE